MKNFFWATLMVAVMTLIGPAQAQDQKAELAQALRADKFPLEAEVLDRFVELEMSPEWWAIMLDPGEERGARQSLRILLSNITTFASYQGWGDVNRLNQDTGRKGNAPPVLAMLDSWKGKVKVKIVMNFAPDDTSKKETSAGLDRMGYPLGSIAKPRAGKLDLTLTYDPKVTEIKSQASADGGTVALTLPAYMSWSQSKVDAIFKRGH